MAAGKTWRDYIKKEYETSADHTLPASAWNWMSVQTKNQLNHQAQRALDLQLLDFLHLIESVTVFERVYDTAILSAWIESIQAVLSHPVSGS